MTLYKFQNPDTDEFIQSVFDSLPQKSGREYKTLELLDKDHSLSPGQIKTIMGMFFFEKNLELNELIQRISHVLLAGENLDFDSVKEKKIDDKSKEVKGIFMLLSDWEGAVQ